jgi:hypothetical protein
MHSFQFVVTIEVENRFYLTNCLTNKSISKLVHQLSPALKESKCGVSL